MLSLVLISKCPRDIDCIIDLPVFVFRLGSFVALDLTPQAAVTNMIPKHCIDHNGVTCLFLILRSRCSLADASRGGGDDPRA